VARSLADFRGGRIYLDTNVLVAVMRRLGLTAIASDDKGFDSYQDQGITVFTPEP
jgi:predicted nucleic acid-binding protein